MIFLQEEDTNFGFRFENCYLKRSSRVFQRSGHDPAFGRNLELEKKKIKYSSELILTLFLYIFYSEINLLKPFTFTILVSSTFSTLFALLSSVLEDASHLGDDLLPVLGPVKAPAPVAAAALVTAIGSLDVEDR
jgi:hypothetical protein